MKRDDSVSTLGDYAGLLRRRWRYPATIIPAGVLLAILLAYLLPVSYRASATIMQEGSSLPDKMVPTTVTGSGDAVLDAAEQLELARRRVMTKESLVEVVKRVDPYPDRTDIGPEGKANLLSANTQVERVDPIKLEPAEVSTTFSIHYTNPDPKIAAAVADELVQLYLTYTRRTRAEQAGEALRFLQAQAGQLEATMQQMEHRLADFKAKYGSALPESQGRNLAGTDRAQREVETSEGAIRLAEGREALLLLQLNEISPSLTAAVGDWRLELAKLRGELALAEQTYTQEHPDVKRLRRAIADLAAQGAASTAAGQERPDNPEYLRIQSELGAVRRELAALRANASRARSDLAKFEENLATSPGVEREYTQLVREYQIAENRYADLQGKIQGAVLAQNLESEARGERMTLIRAPSVPTRPASPNRLGIILLGIVLSGAVAFALTVFKDASDPTVRGSDDLQSIMETAPIGSVPVILNYSDLRQRRWRWGLVSAAYLVATIVVAATIALAGR